MTLKTIFTTLFGCLALTLSSCSSSGEGGDPEPPQPPEPPVNPSKEAFETSYWIDMDVQGKHLRGYWYNVADYPAEPTPSNTYIQNSCSKLRNEYGGNKLYVIYHRQFEIEDAKTVLHSWKTYAIQNNMTVVPTIVLQSYANPQKMNFTNDEIALFAVWCNENINNKELGIYDVYTRDAPGTDQDKQLKLIKAQIGDKLVMVGIQPGVTMNTSYKSGVEDTWTAECQGRTNDLWENPVYYKGHKNYGRNLLETWVKERINNEPRPIAWNMIPVAWDYEIDDPLSYDCPGDDQFKNDPPIPGRIALFHKYIAKCYAKGADDPLFAGYSCDLHILQANSGGRGESPSFYESLRNNAVYNGDFAGTMKEIGDLYKSINTKK